MSSFANNGGYIGVSATFNKFQNISTQGLQLFLDAGNQFSYRGSGATWVNLVNPNLNATLNGTRFTSDAGGGIVFGSGNVATIPTGLTFSGTGTGYTISVWLKHIGTVSASREQRYFTINSQAAVLRHGGSVGDTDDNFQAYFNDASGVTRGLVNVNNQIFVGQYSNLVSVFNGSSMVVYRNGVQVGSAAVPTYGGLSTPSTTVLSDNGASYFDGSMHVVKYYNRPLSAVEVGGNFYALSGRFGL